MPVAELNSSFSRSGFRATRMGGSLATLFPQVAGLAGPFVEAAQTHFDTATPIVQDSQEVWQSLIDDKLIDWGQNPGQFDEAGIEPPSRQVIVRAIEVAQQFSRARRPAPDRVVPDAHGGIVFERQEQKVFETIRIPADDQIEYSLFVDSRLMDREYW